MFLLDDKDLFELKKLVLEARFKNSGSAGKDSLLE
jgi:hypothetical protein